MNVLIRKKTMVNLVSASLLLIGASATQAATFTCQWCGNNFVSGSVSVDENKVWDWTNLVFNFGKEGTFFKFSDLVSTQSNTTNSFTFAYDGAEKEKIIGSLSDQTSLVTGTVVGKVGQGFVDVIWDQAGEKNSLNFDIADGVSRFTLDNPSAVPVPAAALLFAPALVGFAALRRKKPLNLRASLAVKVRLFLRLLEHEKPPESGGFLH